MRLPLLTLLAGSLVFAVPGQAQPRPDHVVIVIFENKALDRIIGNPEAPHINALAAAQASIISAPGDPTGTHTGSHALRHPSQPNYLELFSGSNQGVVQDGLPGSAAEPTSVAPPFNTPNLGASLVARGFSFAIYSEDLPSVGYTGEHASSDRNQDRYERKHNPAVNWQSVDAPANNHLPASINQPFFPLPQLGTGFPVNDFSALPTVSFVIPSEQHNMHDGTIEMADTWLKENIIDTYLAWAQTHNSLLIVTFDEDNFDDPANPSPGQTSNLITTIFAGPMVNPGTYFEADLNANNPDVRPANGFITPTGTAMNHYNILATLADMYGLPRIGGSVNRQGITDLFNGPSTSGPLVVPDALQAAQGDTGNLFPLFSAQPIRYQQVFDASAFARLNPAGGLINRLALRGHGPGIPFTGAVPQLQVNLSTTSKEPDDLSSTFAENVGPNDTQVFTGPLQTNVTFSGDPATFEVLINFTTPFFYHPAQGNLLLDVRNFQGGTQVPPADQQLDGTLASGDPISRAYNYGNASAGTVGLSGAAPTKDTYGLVTRFNAITAASRKVHGNAGAFDIALPLGGAPGIECRAGGLPGEYQVVVTFPTAVTTANAQVTQGTGTASSTTVDTDEVMINLTGVTDGQTIQITLAAVNDGTATNNVTIPMRILVGDTTNNGAVNSSDISEVKAGSGQNTNAANFRLDVTANGAINSSDISLVKSKSGGRSGSDGGVAMKNREPAR